MAVCRGDLEYLFASRQWYFPQARSSRQGDGPGSPPLDLTLLNCLLARKGPLELLQRRHYDLHQRYPLPLLWLSSPMYRQRFQQSPKCCETPWAPTSVCVTTFQRPSLTFIASECVELLDNNMMDAINHVGLSSPFPVKDSLFFKFQGSPSSIAETSRVVSGIVKSHGAELFQSARSIEEADELWNHRKVGFWSTFEWANDPNTRVWTTDVCVPSSRLPQLVKETKEDMVKHGIVSTILGHVGDGKECLLCLQLHSSPYQLPLIRNW